MVERVDQCVPAEHRALDAHGELDDALQRLEIAECHRFAREAGYRQVRLWTNSQLDAAKHIYRKAGYQLVASEPFQGFGLDLVGETWELTLG